MTAPLGPKRCYRESSETPRPPFEDHLRASAVTPGPGPGLMLTVTVWAVRFEGASRGFGGWSRRFSMMAGRRSVVVV